MNERVAHYFEKLKGKKTAVLGIGVSNRPLIRMLLDHGISVIACDKTPRKQLDAEVLSFENDGAELHLGEGYLENLEADVIFRTPGMRPDLPCITSCTQHGAVLTSEMEAFFEVCPCKMIAVTGSDGKTTTTTLISEMLKKAGHTVWVGGNIGQPLLPMAEQMEKTDFAVLELSSFQLMTMRQSADIAVVTNLAPNHLDMHKGMQEYIDAKKNVFMHQSENGKLIVNADNEITSSFAAFAKGSVMEFSRQHAVENGVYYAQDTIFCGGKALLCRKDILLPGIHNVENYMAAILAVQEFVSKEDILSVARTFGGVEHRIELVRELDGVKYYNDSIASSPSRTIAGLHSFDKKVILIAGGYDKHIPFDTLGDEICAHVKVLILCGATEEKIRQAVLDSAQTQKPLMLRTDNLKDAVLLAKEHAVSGDVVTLSPACAAFDQFKNFMVRGKTFKEFVMAL